MGGYHRDEGRETLGYSFKNGGLTHREEAEQSTIVTGKSRGHIKAECIWQVIRKRLNGNEDGLCQGRHSGVRDSTGQGAEQGRRSWRKWREAVVQL